VKRPFAELWGTGSYAPPRVMTNDEFSKILDTSDQWIQERTGIRERRVSTKDETNACMGKAAALQVLQETGLTPLDMTRSSMRRRHPTGSCPRRPVTSRQSSAPRMLRHSTSVRPAPGSSSPSARRKESSRPSRQSTCW